MEDDFPIEYKKGFIKFLNCKIDLRNQVFIPRIETEFWTKKAIKELSSLQNEFKMKGAKLLKVLDIFAGSGCIGIAILKNVKNSRVDFVDIDKRAIKQIKINLKLNQISKSRYKIYKSNLFEKIKNKKHNIIFANPPYVAKERIKEVQPSVLNYEPKTSLLAGKKGLFYIRKFLKGAKRFIKPAGTIYLEFDPLQKDEVKNILEKTKCRNFQFFKDQFKKWRWTKIAYH